MREIRQSGSEGGARSIPRSYPYGSFGPWRDEDKADQNSRAFFLSGSASLRENLFLSIRVISLPSVVKLGTLLILFPFWLG